MYAKLPVVMPAVCVPPVTTEAHNVPLEITAGVDLLFCVPSPN
jgi:hypothetical protein